MRERGFLVGADSVRRACSKGWDFFKNGRFGEAEAQFRQSLSIEEDPEALYGLGVTLNVLGQSREAVSCLRRVIALDLYFSLAYGVLGDIFAAEGDQVAAIEYYAQGVAVDPQNDGYKNRLIQLVRTITFSKINDNLKGVLLTCLEAPGVDLADFGRTWLSIIESDGAFSEVYKLSRHKEYHSFKVVFDRLAHSEALVDPFFLTGLGAFVVPDTAFERLCTHIRRALLDGVGRETPMSPENREYLSCALLRYCALTDYIFEETPGEQEGVKNLKRQIEKQKPEDVSLAELAILGCYMPLYRLKKARKIAESLPGGGHVSQIPKSQISDALEMEKIRKKISTLTPITDEISQKVQIQYEEFPSPFWKALWQDNRDKDVEGPLTGAGAKILVAGCSTGREALELASAFPDAEVSAVDLSKASLSYALFKKAELGIENVTFKHADLLEIGQIEGRFDYIVSSGVLHHLKEPLKGWRALTDLLTPGGLMRIALYSSKARKSVNEIRERIAQAGIGNDAVSIREFRRDIRKHLKLSAIKEIENFPEYYTVPECRDLLFHVQEHQYDIPELKESLEALGLQFVKFYLPADVLEAYVRRYPDDPEAVNLDYWDRWETARPDTFAGMYRFWCRKSVAA